MNQLEALQKLYVKKRTITLPKNPKEGQDVIELEFEPMGLEDSALFGKATSTNISPGESMDLMQQIIAKCLNVTTEELKKVSLEYMIDFMDYIVEIHKLDKGDTKKSEVLKEFMQQKQDASKLKDATSSINSVQ